MNQIISQWIKGKVPMLNGVVEVSGCVHTIRPIDSPRSLPMRLQENGQTRFETLPEVKWAAVIPAIRVQDAESKLVVVVGECGWGGEGFVALQATKAPESLVWLAHFDFSNPFESVRLEKGLIKAHNNIGEEWRFIRSSPWRIEVHRAKS
jgi:hypothetical protein